MNGRPRVTADTRLRFTTFDDTSGGRIKVSVATLNELKREITEVKGAGKGDLPLLSLAIYGDKRTSKGSLRHNANVKEIAGVAIDYDGEVVSAADAIQVLQEAGVGGVVYETPSSSAEKPRWRILAPLSRPTSPDEHRKLTARLNGVLGGIAAPESFVPSQSYYYGAVDGAAEKFVYVVEGDFLDLRPELDAKAIDSNKRQRRKVAPHLERHLRDEVDWAIVYGSYSLDALERSNPTLYARLQADLSRQGKLWTRWEGSHGLKDKSRSGRDRSMVQTLRSMGYTITEALAVTAAYGGSHPAAGRGLVDHDKTGKDIDLERYWVRCWARADDSLPKTLGDLHVAPPHSSEQHSEAAFPDSCREAPGVIGHLVAYFRRASTRHMPEEFLVAMAIATVALAAQNRFDVGDEKLSTSIHVYMIVVAQTGFGKSELGRLIFKLLDPKFASASIVESLASGPALLKRLHRISRSAPFGPTMLYMADEFGLKLQARTSRSGTTHVKDLIDELISAFGKGGSIYTGKGYADARNDIDPIERPSVHVIGFTTEPALADAMTFTDAEIGFVNRFLLLWMEGATAPHKSIRDTDQTVPRELEDFLQIIGSQSLRFPIAERDGHLTDEKLDRLQKALASEGPVQMPLDGDALEWIDQLTGELNQLQSEATGVAATLWMRARQHVLMIAGVLAIAEIDINSPQVPIVDRTKLEWAWKFVRWTIEAWTRFFEGRVSGNDEEAAMNAIKELLGRTREYAPGGRYSDRANYGNAKHNAEFCAKGWMPLSLIGRELRSIRSDIRTRALVTLVDNEEIERDEVHAEASSRPTTVYRMPRL